MALSNHPYLTPHQVPERIVPNQYEEAFEAFSDMNLSSSRVYFVNVRVQGNGWRCSSIGLLPQIELKPYKIIRLIQRILQFLFWKERGKEHLKIAEQLSCSITSLLSLVNRENDPVNIDRNVLEKIRTVSCKIFEKLEKAGSGYKLRIKFLRTNVDSRIKNSLAYSGPKGKEHLKIAEQLSYSITSLLSLVNRENDPVNIDRNLLEKIRTVSYKIFEKLEKAGSDYKLRIKFLRTNVDSRIKNSLAYSRPK